jgi:cold shock CspA family protein
MVAIVQKFSEIKGYGFLLESFRSNIYFHVSGWNSDIPPKIGMRVTYDKAPSFVPGKPDMAVNIVPMPVGAR